MLFTYREASYKNSVICKGVQHLRNIVLVPSADISSLNYKSDASTTPLIGITKGGALTTRLCDSENILSIKVNSSYPPAINLSTRLM